MISPSVYTEEMSGSNEHDSSDNLTYMDPVRKTNIDMLPDEVLSIAFGFVPLREVLLVLVRVNRRWRRVLHEVHSVEIDMTWCKKVLSDTALEYIAHPCHSIRALSVTGCVRISPQGFAKTSPKYTLLRRLDPRNCINITDTTVAAITETCHVLEEVNLSSCDEITGGAVKTIALSCRKLQSLHVAGCTRIDGT